MIRPETGEDITDEEFIKVLKPFVAKALFF